MGDREQGISEPCVFNRIVYKLIGFISICVVTPLPLPGLQDMLAVLAHSLMRNGKSREIMLDHHQYHHQYRISQK